LSFTISQTTNKRPEEYPPLPSIPSDGEIAQAVKLEPIEKIARKAGILPEELELYGRNKAKITLDIFDRLQGRPNGKLILVTAMTATRAGEGKTVTSIGLAQGFGQLGINHMLCLREPSLGPTFGIKGGAAGGGYAQVLPMEDINMHFTGDMHAITTAHNLLAAVVDNHIYHGNELGLQKEKIQWRRAMDLCDRQLRHCEIGLGGKSSGFPHSSGFDITAASEVMAILALSENMADLRRRLENIIVGYNQDGEAVYAKQLNCVGAMCVLLRDALNPNLVQTAEQTPALIHCGPFANIAHGCNSVTATKLGLKLADYVITEAGFAADLGAEKFLDIKCRQAGLQPAAAVLVISCRAMKLHGGIAYDSLSQEKVEAVVAGFENVRVHLENLKKFGVNVVVAINRFPQDTPAELRAVKEQCDALGVRSELSEVAARGGQGGIALAKAVLDMVDNNPSDYHPLYETDRPVKEKIETLAKEIYRAGSVEYSEQAQEKIQWLEANGFGKLPLCVAKTQLSISDDAKKMNAPSGYTLRVKDIRISNGAGFIVVVTGKILLMPGMPKTSAVEKIDMDEQGRVKNLS